MKQTLKQALKLAAAGGNDMGRAAMALHGLPVGGWPETKQAMRQIADYLPCGRAYTVYDFVDAAYEVSAGRYYARVE